jgi:hypothetical protein
MTTITARISPMDHGDKNRTTVPVGALHIAHDLVRILNENSGMGDPNAGIHPFVGVFVCETKLPTEEQVAEAHKKLRMFCEHYTAIADADWETYRKPAYIPAFARWAARYLKVDKPYNISKGERASTCRDVPELQIYSESREGGDAEGAGSERERRAGHAARRGAR